MRKIILFAFLFLSLWCISAQTTLKIMSFNIHSGHDASIKEIADFIKAQDPDLVAIQEVDCFTDRTKSSDPRTINNNIDMACSLAYYTGLQGMFYPALNTFGGRYGNVILCKYGIEMSCNNLLPYVTGTEQRCAGIVKFSINGLSIPIYFVGTHLDMTDLTNGLNQVKKINDLFSKRGLVILAGDFNRRVGTDQINELSKSWTLAVDNEFDHIAYAPATSWKIIDKKIFSQITLSDHSPIMVTLQLNQ